MHYLPHASWVGFVTLHVDPAQHLIAADTRATTADDLDRGLSEVCIVFESFPGALMIFSTQNPILRTIESATPDEQ